MQLQDTSIYINGKEHNKTASWKVKALSLRLSLIQAAFPQLNILHHSFAH